MLLTLRRRVHARQRARVRLRARLRAQRACTQSAADVRKGWSQQRVLSGSRLPTREATKRAQECWPTAHGRNRHRINDK